MTDVADGAPADCLSTLPPELLLRLADFVAPNEATCTLRPLCKSLRDALCEPRHRVVRLSQPVPPHAFAWKWAQPGAMRSFPLTQRRRLVALTAASGCVANLDLLVVGEAGRGGAARCALHWEVSAAAAGGVEGRLEVLKRLVQLGACHTELECALAAAAVGDRAVLVWWVDAALHYWRLDTESELMKAVAAVGSQELLSWAMDRSPERTYRTDIIEPAVHRGRSNVVRRLLLGHDGRGDPPEELLADCKGAVDVADLVGGCDLPTLQALWDVGCSRHGEDPAELLEVCLVETVLGPTPDWLDKVQWLLQQARGAHAPHDERLMDRLDHRNTRPLPVPIRPRLEWLMAHGVECMDAHQLVLISAAEDTSALELLFAQPQLFYGIAEDLGDMQGHLLHHPLPFPVVRELAVDLASAGRHVKLEALHRLLLAAGQEVDAIFGKEVFCEVKAVQTAAWLATECPDDLLCAELFECAVRSGCSCGVLEKLLVRLRARKCDVRVCGSLLCCAVRAGASEETLDWLVAPGLASEELLGCLRAPKGASKEDLLSLDTDLFCAAAGSGDWGAVEWLERNGLVSGRSMCTSDVVDVLELAHMSKTGASTVAAWLLRERPGVDWTAVADLTKAWDRYMYDRDLVKLEDMEVAEDWDKLRVWMELQTAVDKRIQLLRRRSEDSRLTAEEQGAAREAAAALEATRMRVDLDGLVELREIISTRF